MTTVADEHGELPAQAGAPEADWPARSPDGVARRAALEVLGTRPATATSLVTYLSRGSLLVVTDSHTDPEPVLEALSGLELRITVLVADPKRGRVGLDRLGGHDWVRAQVAHFAGHLGKFLVRISDDGEPLNLAKTVGHGREDFDLVLDLGAEPVIKAGVSPPGYYAPRTEEALEAALEALPEMVGEFDKPKYFHYNPDICAHVSSHITGCTRCLDACPTGAIRSLPEQIEVDPFLCQGGGICATTCPTGAITYQFPRVSDLLEKLRRALRRYHDEGGRTPWLLILDDTRGREITAAAVEHIPENVIPLVVEEVGAVGLDSWLAALCYGAQGMSIACTAEPMAQGVKPELEHQIGIANALLEALGLPTDRIQILEFTDGREWWSALPAPRVEPVVPLTGFAAMEEKRTTLRLALDHLYENAPKTPQRTKLPPGSPFGEIVVDRDKCTLCMACVSVCPASALQDGDDVPRLDFIENNCVQCGICESACPEDAISLRPLYTYDSEQRARKRTLNEERPFLCVRCSKPFTTEKMMERIRAKLAGHWMYQDPAQRRRLEMCEDCRVEDIFTQGGGLDPYQKPSGSGDSRT